MNFLSCYYSWQANLNYFNHSWAEVKKDGFMPFPRVWTWGEQKMSEVPKFELLLPILFFMLLNIRPATIPISNLIYQKMNYLLFQEIFLKLFNMEAKIKLITWFWCKLISSLKQFRIQESLKMSSSEIAVSTQNCLSKLHLTPECVIWLN